jgi:hypothetical protein
MITFPKEFIATKYPGYFWNLTDGQLYSVKVTGALKPLAKMRPNHFNHFRTGYQISVRGQKRFMEIEYLKKLKPARSTFPVWEQLELV